jgi:hypothetical protein
MNERKKERKKKNEKRMKERWREMHNMVDRAEEWREWR